MDEFITLDHGSGGKKTAALIDELIVPAFANDALSQLGDAAVIPGEGQIVFSTDSFVVDPYFFPGGDIGKLAVCGTVNDISVSGGEPRYLSLAAVIEEGFPAEDLRQIIGSAARAAKEAGVMIVTGDTKVVEKGKGDGIYLNTSGIGFLRHPGLSPANIRPGDKVLISGNIGDHGIAVMLARHPGLLSGDLKSDCAPLNRITEGLRVLAGELRVMRDPTRGGLATTLCEFVEGTEHSIELDEQSIPVSDITQSACSILGLDPLYSANEGRLIAVVSPDAADEALQIMRKDENGRDAAVIGEVTDEFAGKVIIKTAFGGRRIAAKLAGAQFPRIC